LYVASVLTFGCLYGVLGIGLNFQWNHSGVPNFGFVASFAIGAYCAALLAEHRVPIIFGPVLALLITGVLGTSLAACCCNFRTITRDRALWLRRCCRVIAMNVSWTGASNGISGVPSIFGGLRTDQQTYAELGFIIAVTVLVILLAKRLTESPTASIARYTRQCWAARSLGKDVDSYRRGTHSWFGNSRSRWSALCVLHQLCISGPV